MAERSKALVSGTSHFDDVVRIPPLPVSGIFFPKLEYKSKFKSFIILNCISECARVPYQQLKNEFLIPNHNVLCTIFKRDWSFHLWKALPGFELGSLDSKSKVLTITPQNQLAKDAFIKSISAQFLSTWYIGDFYLEINYLKVGVKLVSRLVRLAERSKGPDLRIT